MKDNKTKKKVLIIILVACFVIAGVIAGITMTNDSQTKASVKDKAAVETAADKDTQKTDSKEDQAKEEKAIDKTEATKAASSSTKNESKSKSQSKSSSSSTSKSDSNKNSTSSHKHNWVAVYKEVDNGYYETVTEKIAYNKCKACGTDITGVETSHQKAHAQNGEKAGTVTAYRYHETQEWVSKIEKVVDYYKCSCGATK